MRRARMLFMCSFMLVYVTCNQPDKTVNPPDNSIPADGLVAEYLFTKGSAANTSGNGFNGTIQKATPTKDRRHLDSSALYFNDSGYIAISADSANNPFNFGTGDFAISAWVCTNAKTDVGGDAAKREIVCKGDPYNSGYAVSLCHDRFAGYVGNTARAGYDSSVKVIADSTWHHLVLQRQSGTIQLFVDTVLQHSYPYGGSVSTAYALTIGKHGTKSQEYFIGSIDNIRFYNRYLKNSEIALLYKDPR